MGILEGIGIASAILKLISNAEDAWSSFKQSGSVKKSFVMESTQALVSNMEAISTGGQKQTWEAMAPLTSQFVDLAVGIANTGAKIAGVSPLVQFDNQNTNTMGRSDIVGP